MQSSWVGRVVGRGGFLRSVLVLASGTALAHGITALALLVLTRLYSPADFNALAVFSSVLSVISVAACLRFDVAISMPDNDSDAFGLLVIALGCAVAISVAVGALALVVPAWVLNTVGLKELKPYLWLLPIGTLLAGSFSALQNWFVREKEFTLIARSRIAQSAACAVTQIGATQIASGPIGLLFGYLLNAGSASLILGYRLLGQRQTRQEVLRTNWKNLKQIWRGYSRFPKYSTWEALANSAAIQVPVILIAALAVGPEAGYLLLAMSVIQAPMALLGTAIGQVYLSQASQEQRQGRLAVFTVEILGGLLKAGLGPLLLVGILSPMIFGALFGANWERAGSLVTWMTPWFILQFLASPISMAIHVTGHQRTAFALQLFGLVLRVLAVVVGAQLPGVPVSEAYAISGALFYLAYLVIIMRCTQISVARMADEGKKAFRVTSAWLSIAILAAVALRSLK